MVFAFCGSAPEVEDDYWCTISKAFYVLNVNMDEVYRVLIWWVICDANMEHLELNGNTTCTNKRKKKGKNIFVYLSI